VKLQSLWHVLLKCAKITQIFYAWNAIHTSVASILYPLILGYYNYCFPLDTLNPLFTTNRWDWQPHRKLGAKFLVVLFAGSTLLLVQSKALDEAPYKLSGAVTKLAGITFWSLPFSYWFDKPWFLIEGILTAVLITPSLGVPNWSVIYINTAQQSVMTLALDLLRRYVLVFLVFPSGSLVSFLFFLFFMKFEPF
jgi:hypothetical protein